MSKTPEERKAIEAARKVLRSGPDRAIINAKGETESVPKNWRMASSARLAIVYIRDDGWTLGCPRNQNAVAEDMWKGDWIGRLNRTADIETGKVVFTLTVFSQQGFEYEACTFKEDGTIRNGKGPVEMDTGSIKPNPNGMSLEALRDKLKRGV